MYQLVLIESRLMLKITFYCSLNCDCHFFFFKRKRWWFHFHIAYSSIFIQKRKLSSRFLLFAFFTWKLMFIHRTSAILFLTMLRAPPTNSHIHTTIEMLLIVGINLCFITFFYVFTSRRWWIMKRDLQLSRRQRRWRWQDRQWQ